MRREAWYAIPSASVERCRASLPAWRERGYRIAVLQNRERGEIPADLTVWRDAYPGWAASVNELCRGVVPRDAAVIITGGDDMLPDPHRHADELLEEFLERFPTGFGIMQPTGDGFMNAGEYCGSPWMGRAWIDHAYAGHGPLHDGYRHNWADHELHWVALGMGVLWQRQDVCQPHAHFSRDGKDPPGYWIDAVAAHDEADVRRFIARRWLGFPGHEPTNGAATPGPSWFASQPMGVAERYWFARYAGASVIGEASARLAALLEQCNASGMKRVALYGAGTELRLSGQALMSAPVEIGWIVDDDPRLHGTRLWNVPIVPIESLPVRTTDAPDAIVLTTRAHHQTMLDRCAPHASSGVRIIGAGPRHTHGSIRSVA